MYRSLIMTFLVAHSSKTTSHFACKFGNIKLGLHILLEHKHCEFFFHFLHLLVKSKYSNRPYQKIDLKFSLEIFMLRPPKPSKCFKNIASCINV